MTPNMTGPPLGGVTTVGATQQDLATYDPALKRIRAMTARERAMRKGGTVATAAQLPTATTIGPNGPAEAQLQSLQQASRAQMADQPGTAGPFAGLGRQRRR